MNDYDFEPPRSNKALIVGGVMAIAIAMVVAIAIVYQHSQRGKSKSKTGAASPTASQDSRQRLEREANAAEIKAKTGVLIGIAADATAFIARLAMLIWLVRDCRSRGVDGAPVWVLLVLVLGFVGLIIYMASRPQGPLAICDSCSNRIPSYAKKCHHCGTEVTGNTRFAPIDPFMLITAIATPVSILLWLIWWFGFAPPPVWSIITILVIVA